MIVPQKPCMLECGGLIEGLPKKVATGDVISDRLFTLMGGSVDETQTLLSGTNRGCSQTA